MATSSWSLLKGLKDEDKFKVGEELGRMLSQEQSFPIPTEEPPAQVMIPPVMVAPTMRPRASKQPPKNPQAVLNMAAIEGESEPMQGVAPRKILDSELPKNAARMANEFASQSSDPAASEFDKAVEAERLRRAKEQLNILYTPEYVAETTDKFLSPGGPLYEDKKSLDEQMEVVRELLQSERLPDLSPIMGVADYLAKSDTARSTYKAPKNINVEDILGYYSDIQKQRQGLRKSALDYFKNLKAGTSSDESVDKFLDALKVKLQSKDPKLASSSSALSGAKFDWQLDETLRKESDEVMKGITDFKDNLFKMETSLASVLRGDEEGGAMLRSQLISFLKTLNKEVGNTAVQEQLSQISPSLKSTEQSITAWFNAGQFKDDPKRSAHLRKLVDFARKNMTEVETKKLDNKLLNFKRSAPLQGKNVEEWFRGPREELKNIKENSPLTVARRQKRDAIIQKIQSKPEASRTPEEKEFLDAAKKKGLIK